MGNGRTGRALLDTDVLRAYRRGEPDALSCLSSLANLGRQDISQLSAMVLLSDAPDAGERIGLGMFFSWCDIHAVITRITRRALRLRETLPPPSLLTVDDAIVAATAIEHGLLLYTLDPTRFSAVPGLTCVRPY